MAGEAVIVQLAAVLVVGIGGYWLSWRLRLPAILVLLLLGFLLGPITGFLNPDALFGDLLLPVVSLSVGLILFEGGLSLRFAELRGVGHVVRNLVTTGALATWVLIALLAMLLLRMDGGIALLLGAILVVTGPTVIIPLLRQVRPSVRVGSVLKWEGIVIDPIGAMLAVLVFEAVLTGTAEDALLGIALGVLETLLVGGVVGLAAAGIVVVLLLRYWVPDFLQNPVALLLVFAAFVLSNRLQPESGLLAVTVMGIALANQRLVSVRHIVEFKENLRVLLLSGLFIVLGARSQFADLSFMTPGALVFLTALVVLVRPLAVALSTVGSPLTLRERAFLAAVAPRGVVAAAVASVFALRAEAVGFEQAAMLAPITFLVIVATVALYGISAAPVARALGVAQPHQQGALILGAHDLGRAIAKALQDQSVRVHLVDTNWANVTAARMDGLPTTYASILSDHVLDDLDLGGIGRLLALTPNDEVNALAALHFADVFGRAEVYQLPPHEEGKAGSRILSRQLRSRLLFDKAFTFDHLAERLAAGATIKTTPLTKEFDYDALRVRMGSVTPLFVVREDGEIVVSTADSRPTPRPGQTVIALVPPGAKSAAPAADSGDQGV